MTNNIINDIQVEVPVDLLVRGQIAVEKINSVQDYINTVKYVDSDVIYGILGIRKMVREDNQDDAKAQDD